MPKKQLRIYVCAENSTTILFERIIDVDSSISVPFDNLVLSLDYLFPIKKTITFEYK